MLDYMKSDVDLNRTLLGGIRGEHWDLNEQGQRVALDAAENYSWNSWAWALNRADEPVMKESLPSARALIPGSCLPRWPVLPLTPLW